MHKLGDYVSIEIIDPSAGLPQTYMAEYIAAMQVTVNGQLVDASEVKVLDGPYQGQRVRCFTSMIKPLLTKSIVDRVRGRIEGKANSVPNSEIERVRSQFEQSIKPKPLNPCQCGAHAVRHARHSHWCPEYR